MKKPNYEGTYRIEGWTFTRISDGLKLSRRRSGFPRPGAETFLHDVTNQSHVSSLFTDKNPFEFEYNRNRYKMEFIADTAVISLKTNPKPFKPKGSGF